MTKISKAEFETLPDSLKPKFKAEGEDYLLQEEDVDGLKKSKAEILEEKKKIQAERDELAKFKAEHEATLEEQETAKQKEAGQFAELEKKLREKITEVEDDRDAKIGQIMSNLKTERLKNLVVEKGVLPDRAEYALTTLADQFDLESEEQGFKLKLKTGIGDPKEIDGAIEALKAKADFLFKPNGASGSGASSSQAQVGGLDLNSMSPEQMLDMANAQTAAKT
jgi:hypothetical protein